VDPLVRPKRRRLIDEELGQPMDAVLLASARGGGLVGLDSGRDFRGVAERGIVDAAGDGTV
jgi:hypothetical protein